MVATVKLMADLIGESVELIAIRSGLADYELAYLLNRYLGTRLSRRTDDLDFSQGAGHAIFEFDDVQTETLWSLVRNGANYAFAAADDDLFASVGGERQHHVVPEYREADFLLKTETDAAPVDADGLATRIGSLPRVETAYSIPLDTLKSKGNLIF